MRAVVFAILLAIASYGASGGMFPLHRNRPDLKIQRIFNENAVNPSHRWDNAPLVEEPYYNESPVDSELGMNPAESEHWDDQGMDAERSWNGGQHFDTGFRDEARIAKSLFDYNNHDPESLFPGKHLPTALLGAVLNMGRRRREPTPELIVDVGSYFGRLSNKMDFPESDSPPEDLQAFGPGSGPSVVHLPNAAALGSGGGGGAGASIPNFPTLRHLRPAGLIRSYNRRSILEPVEVYPGANQHDPGLLWTGLGR